MMELINKIKNKLQEKSTSNDFFWKTVIFGKHIFWTSWLHGYNFFGIKIISKLNSLNIKINPKYKNLDSKKRFVVSKRWAGLGDMLMSAIAAWHYAKKTKRTLVIDWRFSRYSKECEVKKNVFSILFKPIKEIDGVPIVFDDRVNQIKYPYPIYPNAWNNVNINQKKDNYNFPSWKILNEYAESIVRKNSKAEVPTIVFDVSLDNVLPSIKSCKKFLSKLNLQESIQKKVDEFVNHNFKGKKVIGVHLRHGNGEYNNRIGNLFWKDEAKVFNNCLKSIKKAEKKIGDKCLVFLCTDSRCVENKFKSLFQNVIKREKKYMATNKGPLHVPSSGIKGAVDALVEMFLLSYCDALIYYPTSNFTAYARYNKKFVYKKCLDSRDVLGKK